VALEVVFSAPAEDDLNGIYDWIAANADAETAYAYVSRVMTACRKLSLFPARGTPREDLGEGVRTVPYERRAVIAYRVERKVVRILRVLHRGRELDQAFSEELGVR
jgi:toxin ParE1/3/4